MIRHIFILLLLAVTSGLFAQEKMTKSPGPNSMKPDSVKKPRILREWTLSADYSEEVIIPFDTVFSLSNRFKIADKFSPVNATLGNYGLPFYQINFFDRISDPDKFLYSTYYPLMHTSSNAIFMNTQVPYTELDWSFAGPRETSEQTFRVRHSQNVNRFLNFGLIFDIIYDLGQYKYQRAENKTFTFYSSYTGVKYKLYFSAGINNLTAFENGGIIKNNPPDLSKTLDIPVNLGGTNRASSLLKNRNLLIVQRYTFISDIHSKSDSNQRKNSGFFGLSGTFSHILEIETNARTYNDEYPKSGFYDNIFISDRATSDSLHSGMVRNTLRFDFSTDESRKFNLGGGVGIRNEIMKFSHVIPVPYILHSNPSVWNRGSNALVGRLLNNIGEKFRWLATGELYLTGYRIGDFILNGELSKSFDWKKGGAWWTLKGSVKNRKPSFWYEQWGGNNFKWNQALNKEFRIDIATDFSYPARKTVLKVNYAVIKNYTGFDLTAHPFQFGSGLSVAALSAKKELSLWKFNLATDLIIQKSSNSSVLDLPLATVRSAAYFEHLFRFAKTGGRLNFQLGADVTYNTSYHPFSYMPATGRFYRQEKVSAGDYPFINAFLNFKVRRTRVFVMFDHLNAGMLGSNYEMIPDYPMNIRMLRYGLAWTFYN